MAHGYLGDGYGTHGEFDPDRGDERSPEWRDSNRRGPDENWRSSDRNRGRMFSDWDREGGFENRWSNRSQRSYEPDQGGFRGEYSQFSLGERGYSSNPDDHYRSWRDRHMSELDRDYAAYCREREEQFHSDFDNWRSQRHASPQPLRTGMTQTGLSADPTGQTQAEEDNAPYSPEPEDPMASATLGTTSRGRGRGQNS